ncbi:MAG: 1-deoxy-D-xylulose-5-phosphate reductoisomerase [Bacteroidetes bacterium]|nr:1-deoxy-D-xylulose-5-phosphate reductoisomerase [Bacteroidota bacterium]
MKKRVVILGSTGSIGVNTLHVIDNLKDQFEVAGLITYSNHQILNEQVEKYKPAFACLISDDNKLQLTGTNTKFYHGRQAALDLCASGDYDILVSALVGFAGFEPTVAAIRAGKHIALANKETLIVGGHIIKDELAQNKVPLSPIDSEHSAILQCLTGEAHSSIETIILTASGGPFLHLDANEFGKITVERALNHPNWKMGRKITIDSATLMNKGLEVIEARWLFDVNPDQISVVVHPQSIIHSMVQFTDGSVKAQLGVPDMKIPIQYALTYPERSYAPYERVKFSALKSLTFFEPDLIKFPCLRIAFTAMKQAGNSPCVMNAANEVAVDLFLNEKIGFMDIPVIIEETMNRVPYHPFPGFLDVIEFDRVARQEALTIFEKLKSVVV